MAANPLQEFQSVFVRQPQVGQDNPEFPGREGLDGFFGRIRRGGEESVPLQELGQQVVQVHIVIYYQDGFVHRFGPFPGLLLLAGPDRVFAGLCHSLGIGLMGLRDIVRTGDGRGRIR